MTLKKKIVIWYTAWMAVIAVVVAVTIVATSDILARRQAYNDLIEGVHDALGDMRGRGGRIDLDEVDEFDDGIYYQVFDESGMMVKGSELDGVPPAPSVSSAVLQQAGWYVYSQEQDGYAVRGLMRSSQTVSYISALELISLILLPVVIALSALGGYFITRRNFRPVDRMIETADRISQSADLSSRINIESGNDEIHSLAASFDRMIDRLDEAFRKEKQFTSDVSHELRTPLSVINAECEYALRHSSDNSTLVQALESIKDQNGRMTRLTAQLLMLARSDQDRLTLKLSVFDVSQSAVTVLESFRPQFEEKGITAQSECTAPLMVKADEDMITRVIINLVSNAVQYSRENGHIWIRTYLEDDGRPAFSVKDDGIGIAEENQQAVFDRFFQEDSSRTGSSCGLGLSIVKAIAKAHGASVSLISRQGEGSEFIFTFSGKNEIS